jgi:hypothetical protein
VIEADRKVAACRGHESAFVQHATEANNLFPVLAVAGHGTTLVGLPKLSPRMVPHALRLTQS